MPIASLNVRLDALAEHIMASFIILLATRSTIAVGFLDTYVLSIVSIHGVPVHSIYIPVYCVRNLQIPVTSILVRSEPNSHFIMGGN